MYTEASSPQEKDDVARLKSIVIPQTDPAGNCLEFWYHMYGSGMGTLNLYQSNTQGAKQLLWRNTVGKDDEWFVARKYLNNINSDFQVGIGA